jgi:hypothetical protein
MPETMPLFGAEAVADRTGVIAACDPVPETAAATTAPRVTERVMLDALHARYNGRYGNGPRYAVAEHVRSHCSFDARRTADFVAMDLWKSGRLDLHGHEVKVSRSDWLRELKQPEKAAEFIPYMNRWWLVIADAAMVRAGELPAGWGMIVLAGPVLRVVKHAPRRDAKPLTPTRLAGLLRAVAQTAARR